MHRNRSVDNHRFAMSPRTDIPRSTFNCQSTHKTTFDAGYLIPVYLDEVLPGDTFNLNMTAFARLSTPLFPIMDNLRMDSFFFFVPNRLVWDNWAKFMGEIDDPLSTQVSQPLTIPFIQSPKGGYAAGTIFDFMGLPTVGQVEKNSTVKHSLLPLRAYNLVYNQWFRDENLQDIAPVFKGDWFAGSTSKGGKPFETTGAEAPDIKLTGFPFCAQGKQEVK